MPRIPRVSINDAGHPDTRTVVTLLAAAAASTPLAQWLYPDPAVRTTGLRTLLTGLVLDTIRRGRVRIACYRGQPAGAALWLSCTASVDLGRAADLGRPASTAADHQRLALLNWLLNRRHPTVGHTHLRYLAVLPTRRGRGIADALLMDPLARPEADRYLVATSSLHGLLEHRGYRPLGAPMALPGPTALTLRPMWHTGGSPDPASPRRTRSQPAPPTSQPMATGKRSGPI